MNKTREEVEAELQLDNMAKSKAPRLVAPISSLSELIDASPKQLFGLVDHFGFQQMWEVWPLIPEVVRRRIYYFIEGIPPMDGATTEYGDWDLETQASGEAAFLDVFNNVVLVEPHDPVRAAEYGKNYKDNQL